MNFTYLRNLIIFSCLLIVLTLTVGGGISVQASDKTGIIDFSHHDPAQEFYTNLNGEWYFFEEMLLTPKEVNERLFKGEGTIVSLPDSFQSQTGNINSYGTYSIKVKIPKEYKEKALAIHIPYQYSAYSLYAGDSMIAQNGKPGTEPSSHIAEMAPRSGYFVPQSEEIQLTMQVSSFDHIRGGFENPIYLGDASVVVQKFNTSMIGTLFINGCIFIIGLFMVLFALYRRKDHTFFIFGLFAVLISARALFAVPFYYTLIFPDMSWLWGTRWEYILTEATSMIYVILLWKWHEKEFSRKIMYGLVVVHSSLIIATLFTQPVFFQELFFKVFYLAIPTFFYLIYVVYKSIRNHNKTARINLIGMGIIFIAFFNDFAIGQNWYKFWNLMLPAVGVYVLIHVLLMSKDFADKTQKTEQQNKQLLALNASNEELTVQLQKEIKQKDDFLANTSHELRNPLHGIINITQSILRNRSDNLDKKTQDDLTLQLTVGYHMSQTLGDLLDITRLKEHRIRLRKENLDIQTVSETVMDMLKVLLENKSIQMSVNIPDDFPYVYADKNRLIQILFNLLHNAVKYTEKGEITVTAERKGEMAHIHVTDTGIGMNDNILQSIFEPYAQGDSSITAIGGGLGLGLSICKQLVELHGGTMLASSVPEEGSQFTFTLPVAESQSEAQISMPSLAASQEIAAIKEIPNVTGNLLNTFIEKGSTANKASILAVDDDPVNLRVLKNILAEERYAVETVTSGEAALKKLESKEWDLVISDVMMPAMSGYELTRLIREKFSISELPILLLTARGNTEDIYTGFLSGANDYVTKPVDAVELNARVHALTNLQASVKERLRMEAAWLQAQIRPHFLLNTLTAIAALSEVDTARMAKLLEKLAQYLQSSFYMKNTDKLVPLEHELDLLDAYLYIEKERFGERLNVKWDVETTENVMVPPLSIQTLVENAVNHGILKRISGGTVTIRVKARHGSTEIAVADDGIGMDDEQLMQLFAAHSGKDRGIGLVNTEQRLKRLYGNGLEVQSESGKGTSVTFTVPGKTFLLDDRAK